MGKIRLITNDQRCEGYLDRIKNITHRREFHILQEREDGTFVVEEPKTQGEHTIRRFTPIPRATVTA